MNAVMNLRVCIKCGEFLTSLEPVSFSRTTLLAGVSYQVRVFHNSEHSDRVPVGNDGPHTARQGLTNFSMERTASIFRSGCLPTSKHDGVVTQKPVIYMLFVHRLYIPYVCVSECMYVTYVYKYVRISLGCGK